MFGIFIYPFALALGKTDHCEIPQLLPLYPIFQILPNTFKTYFYLTLHQPQFPQMKFELKEIFSETKDLL
jgi:hypothetical protein